MPQPRYRLVDTQTTPYYHCISRCVRRAFLCGYDHASRKHFDHRKQWILDRIKTLSSAFAVDVCAYAIMSNHFHLVLHVDRHRAQHWSPQEVIDRWLKLYTGPVVAHRYQAGLTLSAAEQRALEEWVAVWRSRLCDLSWYMRCLNETIARMANKEDQCTGRFWEGRFRSQALLGEAALVSCMAYVDLNPIRAKKCKTLEQSDFTSIQERLRAFTTKPRQADSPWLASLGSEGGKNDEKVEDRPKTKDRTSHLLPIRQTDYFALVDWTGRAVRTDKRAAIPPDIQPILNTLGVKPGHWVDSTRYFGSRFGKVLGHADRIREFAERISQQWIAGITQARVFYS